MQEIEGVNVQLMGARQRAGFEKQEAPRDTQLLERIAARDLKAFEQLYRHYQPRLARFRDWKRCFVHRKRFQPFLGV